MNNSETLSKLIKALVSFHKDVVQPMKDADNPYFKSKYVPLENVVEAVDKTAPDYGLTYVQYPVSSDSGAVGIATILLHDSGEFMELPAAYTKPDKHTPQGVGSALTYMRRYALSAVFGITSDKDDDGNEASGNRKENKQANNKTIDELKKAINEFAEVLESAGQEIPPEEIAKRFGVKNYNLSEGEAAQIIKRINANAKKYTGGENE